MQHKSAMFFLKHKKELSGLVPKTSSGCFPRSLRSWLKELGAQGLDLIELGSKSGPETREAVGKFFVGWGENWVRLGPRSDL